MERLKKLRCIDSFTLKLLAMALMLCDHMWATIIPGNLWLTCLGRLAFPIFAYQIVEGFFCTRSFRRYWGRLFLFALLSEVPFNLMYGGSPVYPFHQNVLFTFCLALLLVRLLEKVRERSFPLFLAAAPGRRGGVPAGDGADGGLLRLRGADGAGVLLCPALPLALASSAGGPGRHQPGDDGRDAVFPFPLRPGLGAAPAGLGPVGPPSHLAV